MESIVHSDSSAQRWVVSLKSHAKTTSFLLFMNSKKEVVLAWDLRDTTQRWADESLWTMDSTTRTVCCDEIQTEYFNTYRFSDEDFQTQK